MADRAIICLGNPARSDDGVGRLIAAELTRREPALTVHVSDGEPGALLELWSGLARVVLVDAVVTGRNRAGTVEVLDAAMPLPLAPPTSSHGIGLAEAIELGRSLGRLPHRVCVVGIEAGSLAAGGDVTPAVRAAIPEAVDRVLAEIHHA